MLRFFGSLKLRIYILILVPVLIFILWYNFKLIDEVETLLNHNQASVQSEWASLLADKLSKTNLNLLESKHQNPLLNNLKVQDLSSPINADGRIEDWRKQLSSANQAKYLAINSSFKALVGRYQDTLNIFITVFDEDPVLSPRLRKNQNTEKITLHLSDDGSVSLSIFPQNKGGLYFDYENQTGHQIRFKGSTRLSEIGYSIEATLPLAILGDKKELAITVLNATADSEDFSYALPISRREHYYLPELISEPLQDFLLVNKNLPSQDPYIILDKNFIMKGATRENKKTGHNDLEKAHIRYIKKFINFLELSVLKISANAQDFDYPIAPIKVARKALDTLSTATLTAIVSGNDQIILAAHPIIRDNQPVGVVIATKSKDNSELLSANIPSVILLTSATTLIGVFLLIFVAISSVVSRLGRLGQETQRSIDQYGRLRAAYLYREINSGDEIGDLARNLSSILSRLHQHNQFLEHMPRTLRHEINNPLNVVSTSLQNLTEENRPAGESKYMESARRGVVRIGSIVQDLADAVSLEESLRSEDQEVLDICRLLENYVANCRISHKEIIFDYRGPHHPIYAQVSDYRIEQLLDKIIDNAIDFRTGDSKIQIQLITIREKLQIMVTNYGPKLLPELENSLFDSMVTDRSLGRGSKLHFGLGLYVVRVIAEHHGGKVIASNLVDGSGVKVTVTLPRSLTHNTSRAKVVK